MRKIMDNLEDAAAKLQNAGEKAVDHAKNAFDKVGDNIERAMDEAREALGRALDSLAAEETAPCELTAEEEVQKPLTFGEALDQEVESQVSAIRSAQQTPGAFSDYIAKKFGKDK